MNVEGKRLTLHVTPILEVGTGEFNPPAAANVWKLYAHIGYSAARFSGKDHESDSAAIELKQLWFGASDSKLPMADGADTIRINPLFSGLSREDVLKIMGYLVDVEFAAGDQILAQGDKGDALYLIQSGVVHVQVASGGDRPETIAELGLPRVFWRHGSR